MMSKHETRYVHIGFDNYIVLNVCDIIPNSHEDTLFRSQTKYVYVTALQKRYELYSAWQMLRYRNPWIAQLWKRLIFIY